MDAPTDTLLALAGLDHTRVDIPARGAAAVIVTDPDGLRIELVQSRTDPARPPQIS